MKVSLCVIAYNEENVLNHLLEDIKQQDYPHCDMEIVLIDNGSTDRTRDICLRWSRQEHGFSNVAVVTIERKNQAGGWNAAFEAAKGDIVIRVDAHASIPKDFVRNNVETIESGEDVCGGPRPCTIDESTPWRETLLLAEESMFGSSVASYRRDGKPTYVNSVFHGAYKREVIEKTGFFNEELGRTEDNEYHYRVRQNGYKICFNPKIRSFQHIRNSLPSMLKQKYSNGLWIGITTKICPQCLSIYHYVPFAFVCAIILSTIACIVTGIMSAATAVHSAVFTAIKSIVYLLTKVMWAAYWIAALVMSAVAYIKADKKQKNITNILLPVLFFLLHISYGIGTAVGLLRRQDTSKGNRHDECE